MVTYIGTVGRVFLGSPCKELFKHVRVKGGVGGRGLGYSNLHGDKVVPHGSWGVNKSTIGKRVRDNYHVQQPFRGYRMQMHMHALMDPASSLRLKVSELSE